MRVSLQRSPLVPLVLATMASQSLLVVLAPTIVAIGSDLGASVGLVGQARSVTAGVAIAASVAITGRIERVGVPRTLGVGAVLAVAGSAAVAAAPSLWLFLAAHAVVGVAFACLLTAGFAGVAAFPAERRSWALGYVTGANALAWIVVNPIVGALTGWLSWRVAHAVPAAVALGALLTTPAAISAVAAGAAPRLRSVLATASARRWIAAELMAYAAWTALLTFIGAFFIRRLGVSEATAGWLLASGAAAYFAASTHSAVLTRLAPRRNVVAAAAVMMAALIAALFASDTVPVAVAIFCLVGMLAGIRTPASARLGLEQLPGHPGAMMAARTATTQLGYLAGAVIGGALINGAGYGVLGVVLAASMVASALLVLRVDDDASVSGAAARRAA
jgi:predicted MFS family arabinose efflux permease